ncbi:DUF2207 domain-containing protein [Loigolactobacillus bifermentans]|uniref:Integral membrane protein n=1 Tax=Loigolactobacillus bifermentans DSM 20003 TaxID=1423726 RepID=A0A0R1GF27_9LACO|nr:DUF2207 domain-containing protein [Loigolactobacillus bifermentans]KRK32521.1 integral membrane protein [Loigolactobacillus bifermentans DSM 20003]QGG60196.1 DUF2207 domain-containing protein [Loigolactobacillus bifermentans]
MRQYWGRLWGVLFGLLLGFSWQTTQVQARSYEITDYNIQVNVQKNGNAQVAQRVTYDFDGAFNGVYYQQDVAGTGGLSNPSLFVLKGERLQRLTASPSELPQTYSTTRTAKNVKFKVYYPAHNDNVTFLYRYTLKDVVTNWADTAELNWKIIGTGWEVPLHQVKITVQLPRQNVPKLQAWTHGPLSGTTQVKRQAGRVVMQVNRVPAHTFVESHLVFPTNVTPLATKQRDAQRLKTVQRQEAQLARQANQRRQRAQLIPVLVSVVLLALALGHLVYQGRWFHKHPAHRVKQGPPVHNFEIPNLPAAQAQGLLAQGAPDTKGLTAWLLELAAAGEIMIQPEKSGRKTTYRLTQTGKLTAAHREEPLLRYLFQTVGRQTSAKMNYTVTMAQIRTYGQKKSTNPLATQFEKWQRRQERIIKGLGYYDTHNAAIRTHGWLLGSLNLVPTLGALIAAAFSAGVWRPILMGLALLLLGSSLGLAFYRLWHLSPYNQAGELEVDALKGFKRMLHDIGHFEQKQVSDLILWEQILPYAVAFGSAKQVIKAMRTRFDDNTLQTAMPLYYPLFFAGDFGRDSFVGQFNTDFSTGIQSSSSGSSGGFSGGSSGGFGGGSGGGAF